MSGEISSLDFSTVVIVPDIHGDSDSFLRSIWLAYNDDSPARIVYEEFITYFPDPPAQPSLLTNNSDTVLVQLGDIFDRGPNGLRCLRILDLIPSVLGWKVVRIYGNHEIMNRVGSSHRYVHPLESAQFSAAFPEHRDARGQEFQPGGSVWESIVNNTVLIARFGSPFSDSFSMIPPVSSSSTLFVHAGIEPLWVDRLLHRHNKSADVVSIVDSINEIAHHLITKPIVLNQHDVFNSFEALTMRQSPLWIRDMPRLDDEYVCEVLLPPILAKFQTARIIVGHTADVEDLKIRSLCGSRIILADAAMSRWMLQVQWSAADLDPLVPPVLDHLGRPAIGNPTVLMMRQMSGALSQLKALYYNSTLAISSQQPIYPESCPSLFIPKSNPASYRVSLREPLPVGYRNMFSMSPPVTGTNTGIFYAEVNAENIGQKIGGLQRYRFLDSLRRKQSRGLFNSFGLPFISFISKPDPQDTSFYIIFQTTGIPLRQLVDSEMTLALTWVRQIFLIIRDLRESGVCINFHGHPTDPATVLDMFIVENETELVKLVDFANLFEQSAEVCEKDLAQYLAIWCAQFVRVTTLGSADDHIPFARLVFEVFGLELLGTSEHYFDELIRDILEVFGAHPTSGRSSSTDSFPLVDEFIDSTGFGEPSIAEFLRVRQTMPLVSTLHGSIEIIVTDTYTSGVTLVHIAETHGDSPSLAFRHLLSFLKLEDFRIPPVLNVHYRMDESTYVLLNATGDSLLTVYSSETERIHARVGEQIRESLRNVHRMGVMFDLADLPLQSAAFKVLELFIIDEARENVYLVFLPAMRLVRGESEPMIQTEVQREMAKVDEVIDCAFISKTLLSMTRGTFTFPGLMDEGIKSSHPYGAPVVERRVMTTMAPHTTTDDFDQVLDSIVPRFLPRVETTDVAVQPTTVRPSGSFQVSLRTGIYFNISTTTEQFNASVQPR